MIKLVEIYGERDSGRTTALMNYITEPEKYFERNKIIIVSSEIGVGGVLDSVLSSDFYRNWLSEHNLPLDSRNILNVESDIYVVHPRYKDGNCLVGNTIPMTLDKVIEQVRGSTEDIMIYADNVGLKYTDQVVEELFNALDVTEMTYTTLKGKRRLPKSFIHRLLRKSGYRMYEKELLEVSDDHQLNLVDETTKIYKNSMWIEKD